MTINTNIEGEIFQEEEMNNKDAATQVQLFARQTLVARIFAASYIGRFFVESLNVYRDVLQINEEHSELLRDLEIVRKRIKNFYGGVVWTAITGPADMLGSPSGHCLWVKIEKLAFGRYWFMIENVSFCKNGEMAIQVRVMRNLEPVENEGKSVIDFNEIKYNILKNVQETITWSNFKESAKFLFLFLMTIITTVLYGLQYLGDYSIKFFREFNNFIRVATPIFLHILDLISKVIGGFYILLAMMWRGHNHHQQPPPSLPSIKAPPQPLRQIKPLYNRRQF